MATFLASDIALNDNSNYCIHNHLHLQVFPQRELKGNAGLFKFSMDILKISQQLMQSFSIILNKITTIHRIYISTNALSESGLEESSLGSRRYLPTLLRLKPVGLAIYRMTIRSILTCRIRINCSIIIGF